MKNTISMEELKYAVAKVASAQTKEAGIASLALSTLRKIPGLRKLKSLKKVADLSKAKALAKAEAKLLKGKGILKGTNAELRAAAEAERAARPAEQLISNAGRREAAAAAAKQEAAAAAAAAKPQAAAATKAPANVWGGPGTVTVGGKPTALEAAAQQGAHSAYLPIGSATKLPKGHAALTPLETTARTQLPPGYLKSRGAAQETSLMDALRGFHKRRPIASTALLGGGAGVLGNGLGNMMHGRRER